MFDLSKIIDNIDLTLYNVEYFFILQRKTYFFINSEDGHVINHKYISGLIKFCIFCISALTSILFSCCISEYN